MIYVIPWRNWSEVKIFMILIGYSLTYLKLV